MLRDVVVEEPPRRRLLFRGSLCYDYFQEGFCATRPLPTTTFKRDSVLRKVVVAEFPSRRLLLRGILCYEKYSWQSPPDDDYFFHFEGGGGGGHNYYYFPGGGEGTTTTTFSRTGFCATRSSRGRVPLRTTTFKRDSVLRRLLRGIPCYGK